MPWGEERAIHFAPVTRKDAKHVYAETTESHKGDEQPAHAQDGGPSEAHAESENFRPWDQPRFARKRAARTRHESRSDSRSLEAAWRSDASGHRECDRLAGSQCARLRQRATDQENETASEIIASRRRTCLRSQELRPWQGHTEVSLQRS